MFFAFGRFLASSTNQTEALSQVFLPRGWWWRRCWTCHWRRGAAVTGAFSKKWLYWNKTSSQRFVLGECIYEASYIYYILYILYTDNWLTVFTVWKHIFLFFQSLLTLFRCRCYCSINPRWHWLDSQLTHRRIDACAWCGNICTSMWYTHSLTHSLLLKSKIIDHGLI